MNRRMMKSKIHRARVTDAHLDYVGSISLDPELMRLADILVGEQVHVVDIDNGARFETYAIEGRPGEWHDGSPKDRKDLIEYLQGIKELKERLYLNFTPAAQVPADWVSAVPEVSYH